MENLMKNGSCHVMAGNKRLLIADTNEVQRIELTDFASKTVTMKTGCGFAEGALADLLNFRRDTDVGECLAALVEGVVANLRERWGQQGEVFAGHSRWEQFESALVLRAEVALYARVARVVLVYYKLLQA